MSAAEWVATACNPAHSVVVEACAGSGKTWLLTARLFRLLLAEVPAHRIVAITFTRKAAQEMHERLGSLLAQCALATEAELKQLLAERGAKTDADTCARARALAGQVLTDGRGVVIDTFHGWFASLCQLAPLSMGFSRQAEPTEHALPWQQLAIRLYVQSLVPTLGSIASKPAAMSLQALGPEQQALFTLATHLRQSGLQHILAQALQQRVACTLWLNQPGPCLLEQFWLDAQAVGQNPSQWPQQCLHNPQLPVLLDEVVHGLRLGTAAQQREANRLLDLRVQLAAISFEDLRDFFLTQQNTPRTGSPFKPTKNQIEHPLFDAERFAHVCTMVCDVLNHALDQQREWQDWQCTQALKTLLPGLFATYDRCMKEANVCDFDQLEAVALNLLCHPDECAYVLQKMDARAAHLLLDEFQDTNPVQWAIVRLWLEQYEASEHPTVFMVGDPKQSIYRFRRAEARLFGRVRTWLAQHFGAVVLESNQTRRCEPGVVEVVNAVFAPAVRQSRTHFAPHHSLATVLPSPVALVGVPKAMPIAALRRYPPCATVEEEAAAVAQALQTLQRTGEVTNLAEVLVLVQTRQTGHVLAQAMRSFGLPFVIKDAGERYRTQVWDDTLALLYFLQDPHNNLALLTVLRSPLVGLGSAQLQILSNHAAEQKPAHSSVWQTLESLSVEQPWGLLYQRLHAWVHAANTLPLLETLHLVCAGDQALQAYLNVAQPEQRDLYATHWNWMKGWVLGIQQGRFVSVQQAIDAALALQQHGASEGEVESSVQGLRIMTIHSAKGLEAKHVWLFFCDQKPNPKASSAGLVLDWPLDSTAPHSITVMGNTQQPSLSRSSLQEAQQAAFSDEADHLLYVALTRARTALHVSTTQSKHAKRGWYARLAGLGADVPWPVAVPLSQTNVHLAAPSFESQSWMYDRYPSLHTIEFPKGLLNKNTPFDTVLQTAEQRMGQAWHALLEQLNWRLDGGFDAWWQARWFDCEAWLLDLSCAEQEEVRQACAAVWHSTQVQAWLAAPSAVVLPELRWMLPQEQEQAQSLEQTQPPAHKPPKTLRADCVVVLPTHVLVLDYKWTVNASNLPTYTEQVRRYVACVEHTVRTPQHGPTKAALLDRTATLYPIELG